MHVLRSMFSSHTRTAFLMMAWLMLWMPCAPTLTLVFGEQATSHQSEDPSDQKNDKQGKVEVTQLNEAVIPVYKLDVVFFVSFIQELGLLEEVLEISVLLDTPFPRSTYLQTLFRRIISPNAP